MDQQKNWSDHLKLGDLQLNSRIVLTSLTRVRCDPKNGIPTDLLVQYYTQRAGASIILTEASSWSPQGDAFPGAGNIYTKQHAEGWKKVIDSVHKKGAKIFIQMVHAGRATHPLLNGNRQVLSASSIAIPGQRYPKPKQMTQQDIKNTLKEFEHALILAKEAGFDGIQLHGAHGYLIDQFLRSQTNNRTDKYGGSVQNRIRFCLELIDIALKHLKPHQIGIKISPVSRMNDMFDNNPVETFSLLLKQLSIRNIGFVEIRESTQTIYTPSHYKLTPSEQIGNVCKTLRPFFNGLIIANDSFTSQKGIQAIRNRWADLVSFGRLYICNPDLAERILKGLKLNEVNDYKTFYGIGPKGYTDYPFYEQWIKTQTEVVQK